MTTEEKNDGTEKSDLLAENIAKMEDLSSRLMAAMAQKRQINPGLQGPGQDLFAKAAAAYTSEMFSAPSKLFETQAGYWGKALSHYIDAQQQFAQGQMTPPEDNTPADPRFRDENWAENPFFNFIKQQYLMSSEAISQAVEDLDDLEETDHQRLRYFTRQIIDMMSPTNFLGTNPQALEKAVETQGQSLVDGLENLVRDVEGARGELLVTLADKSAFELGRNVATTEGSVVYRNEILELIHYKPVTETVHKVPLIIFPPWINKFYILDLKAQNSLIKWIVEQDYSLFVVSWKNPDASYRDFGMGDYIERGYLDAIAQVKAITGEPQVNTIGYCIAGTTLSLTLALLEKRGDKSIKSATFFTALTDFSDQGEFAVFLTDDFMEAIEEQAKRVGVLENFIMSRTFSYLRSNDLIYGPAIRSYMLGEAPPAFDLLFWNGDGAHLPAAMLVEYLHGLCRDNHFVTDGFEVLGEKLHISDVKVPVFSIACETDHIAAWKSCYNGFRQYGSRSKTFLLSESGHIAGIVNPPSKKKYGHYLNKVLPEASEDWQAGAKHLDGSWWPTWEKWLKSRSGKQVPARQPGAVASHPILASAPGTYVKEAVEID